jgi:hypothetical protein
MLFGESVAVYCENHSEHRDTLCGQNVEFVTHSKLISSTPRSPNGMLFGEKFTVHCENHMEYTDTLCGQNLDFLTHRNHITPPLQTQPVKAVWGNNRCLL